MQVSRAAFLSRDADRVLLLYGLSYSPNSLPVATVLDIPRRLCFHSDVLPARRVPPTMQALQQPLAQTHIRFIRRILRCNRAVLEQLEHRNLLPLRFLRAVGRHVANVNVVSSNLIARLKATSGQSCPGGLFRALSSHPVGRYDRPAQPGRFPFRGQPCPFVPCTGLRSGTKLVTGEHRDGHWSRSHSCPANAATRCNGAASGRSCCNRAAACWGCDTQNGDLRAVRALGSLAPSQLLLPGRASSL